MFGLLFKNNILRTPEEQNKINIDTKNLSLYHSTKCAFCLILIHRIKNLSIHIELIDINKDRDAYNKLLTEGGKSMVPCLRINKQNEDQWMYESSDIIAYLGERFQK